jgi:hypothetical protein
MWLSKMTKTNLIKSVLIKKNLILKPYKLHISQIFSHFTKNLIIWIVAKPMIFKNI